MGQEHSSPPHRKRHLDGARVQQEEGTPSPAAAAAITTDTVVALPRIAPIPEPRPPSPSKDVDDAAVPTVSRSPTPPPYLSKLMHPRRRAPHAEGPAAPPHAAVAAAPQNSELPPSIVIHRATPPRKGNAPQASHHAHTLGTSLPPVQPIRQQPLSSAPKTFTDEEIKAVLANDPTRLIVVIRGQVYDVTNFVDEQPGGPSVLRRNNGKDIAEAFYSLYGAKAADRLPEFLMGRYAKEKLAAPAAVAAAASPPPNVLSMEGIRHSLAQDANLLILILFGDAYDITAMRNTHPGGLRVLLNYNGKECGDIFMRIHGPRAKKMVHQYLMGRVPEAGNSPSPLLRWAEGPKPTPTAPVNPRVQSTRILEKEAVSAAADLQYVTFSSPNSLRIIPGGHVKLYSDVLKDEWRYYTPFQTAVASFTVCIKRYPNGRTSNYLLDQPEGTEVFFEGPFAPSWEVQLDSHVRKVPLAQRHVLLLAAGTGIAPMYAIAVDAMAKQTASITLVCSVHTPDELMLVDEINTLAARYTRAAPGQSLTFRVALTFSRVPAEQAAAMASPMECAAFVQCGKHVDIKFLKKLELPATQAVVLCGPPAFNDDVASTVLAADVCPVRCIHCL